ncbi:1-phosphofructokinase family hexose kinase [Pararhodobacter oceanensis]|uniref:1-phosphofructokinase family hexose kinase n=1 Tax=Pararhodobacter oceanensis TaxID=2172121 RepID=UPI003A900294
MSEILTVTLNPCLDLSAATPQVSAGPKLRLQDPREEPGGGGINVARAIAALGGQATAAAALGGVTGARVMKLLEPSGVTVARFRIEGETRQSLAVTEDETGAQYRFVMPGPLWSADLAAAFLTRVREESQRIGAGAVVVLSGSQPQGVPDDFAQELARQVAPSRLIVDTSGSALSYLVAHPDPQQPLFALRMDLRESEALAGRALDRVSNSLDFAQTLVRGGVAQVVILARGAEGSVLASKTLRLHCAPPDVPVASKVGAGDSFTGGFALALAQGADLAEALRTGTAAASAAVMTPGSGLCRAEDVARLSADCQIHTLP